MKQRDFSFQSIDDPDAAVPAIADYVHATTHADALIMMLVKWVEEEDAQRLLDAFDLHVPDLFAYGSSYITFCLVEGSIIVVELLGQ